MIQASFLSSPINAIPKIHINAEVEHSAISRNDAEVELKLFHAMTLK